MWPSSYVQNQHVVGNQSLYNTAYNPFYSNTPSIFDALLMLSQQLQLQKTETTQPTQPIWQKIEQTQSAFGMSQEIGPNGMKQEMYSAYQHQELETAPVVVEDEVVVSEPPSPPPAPEPPSPPPPPPSPTEMTDEQLTQAWVDAGSVPNDDLGDALHDRGLADPYEVDIDGKKYMFVSDKNDNKKADDQNEILGINDTKDNLFAGMKSLDLNQDGKVTAEEMATSKVLLNEVVNGQLTNNLYDLSNIDGLDLSTFNAVDNKNATGTFGTFDLALKNGRTAKGTETFEDQKYFERLLATA